MRNFFAILVVMMLGIGSLAAQNTNSNALVGRAHQAVGACVGQARQQFQGDIQHDVQVVGSCTVSGFLYRVSFYTIIFGPPCNPNLEDGCHPPLPILQVIATVDFDCAGNVIGSECYMQ